MPLPADRRAPATTRPETELLLLCARTRSDPRGAQRIADLLGGDLDWTSFVRQALGHDVLPVVYTRLRAIGSPAVPPGILQRLGFYFADHVRRNARLAEETLGLLARLDGRAIPALALKGPALAVAAYGDLALRTFVDLDFLIRRRDALQVKAIMLASGYRLLTSVDDATGWPTAGAIYSFDFAHPNGAWSVEFHWRLTPVHLLASLDFEQCRGRRHYITLAATPVPTLTDEDTLLALCVHGEHHYWSALKWICDVAELTRTAPGMDWGRVEADARRLGCWRMVMLGLRLASDLLEAPIPDRLVARVRGDARVSRLAARVEQRILQDGGAAAGADPSPPYHPYELLERLRDWMWNVQRVLIISSNDRRFVRLPKSLGAAYYPVRLIRLCATYGLGPLIKRLRVGPSRG